MTRFLAVFRRILLAGAVSFVAILLPTPHQTLQFASGYVVVFRALFALFSLYAPISYLVLTMISTIYIRKKGQFAAVHQQQSWFTSFFRCIGHDLASPFKNVAKFISSRGRNTDLYLKKILARRFILMLVLIAICVAGVLVQEV